MRYGDVHTGGLCPAALGQMTQLSVLHGVVCGMMEEALPPLRSLTVPGVSPSGRCRGGRECERLYALRPCLRSLGVQRLAAQHAMALSALLQPEAERVNRDCVTAVQTVDL